MKRLIALLLALAMCFSLAACGKKAEEEGETEKKKSSATQLELNKEYEVSGLTFTLTRVYISPQITNYNAGEVYVDMVFDVVNTGSESVDCDAIMSLVAVASGETYEDTYFGVVADGSEYPSYQPVATGKRTKLHAAVSVPETESSVKLKVKAGKKSFTYEYTMRNDDKLTTPIAFNTKTIVDGVGEFTITKVYATPKISAPMGGYSYNSSNGNVFVDVVFDFVNTSSVAVISSSIMKMKATGESGAVYTNSNFYAEKNMTSISSYESINPLSATKLHAAVEVPEAEKKATLEFEIGAMFFTLDFDTATELSNAAALKVGDVIGTDTTAKAELVSCEFTEAVYPTDTSGYHYYYKVDNANETYLALQFNITNYGSTSKDAEDFVFATAEFMDKYNYSGFVVSEDDDKTALGTYNYIKPLATAKVYYLFAVPKTVIEESYAVTVVFDGQEYVLTVDKTAAQSPAA